MTSWAEHAIRWHAYPLGFLDAPREAGGDGGAGPVPRLRGLVPWLDHLVELGANALLLGPVFASETHGYDTVDHFAVDSRLGTEEDLRLVVGEAQARGVKVVLDGVFNHVGRSFPQLVDVVERGDASPYAGWFRRAPGGEFSVFEGHERLVELDHTSPGVVDYVTRVVGYWLDRGVDGWRLDAAYAVPTPFWRQVTDRARVRHPEAWFLGEVIHGDYPAYVRDGGLDSVTQYELWKAVWSSLNDGNFLELAWARSRHDGFLEELVPQTFLGNHDVTRIASRLTDPRALPLAVAVLMTVGGVPSVYAGDEHGFTGVKEDRPGGDDAVRPPFPATPADLSPLGEPTYALHRELIALRRRHPWLTHAHTTALQTTNRHLAYESRTGDRALVVLLSTEENETRFQLPPGRWQVEAGNAEVGGSHAVLPAHGWGVLSPVGE